VSTTTIPTALTASRTIRLFALLRWRLLRGILRSEGSQKYGVMIGFAAALAAGLAIGIALAVAGHQDDDSIFVLTTVGLMLVVVMIGVIAGVTQPVDPRVLATEPISDRHLGIGLLTATAVGPPGVSAILIGIGLFVGALRNVASIVPTMLAVVAFLFTLLFISRATINTLGLFATRFPRSGQIVVGVSSLVFYGSLQFIPRLVTEIDEGQRQRLARAVALSPPGQLGKAMATAGIDPLASLAHVAVGAAWLIPLGALFTWTTRHLVTATKRNAVGKRRTQGDDARRTNLIRRACGQGAAGAVAWRGLLTRLRTPSSALVTFTGAGVGLAIVLVPTLTRNGIGAGAVLIGGAVQLAVLFMAGNSFGADGPALANELLTGVDPSILVRGKARSIVIVASPVAVVGPLLAAAITGEWKYLPAGFLVGIGGLLAGTGAAVVQSTLVPIAIPESDNPLASGDSGKGCLSGLILAALLTVLAIVTLPVALGLLWALDRGSLPLVTLGGVATLGAGSVVLIVGERYASSTWRRKEPELYAAVIPAR
jgi:hypothetical protein